MTAYDLDENLVRAVIAKWHQNTPDWGQVDALIRRLADQTPIPVPTKIGAVVRTTFRDAPGAYNPTDGVFIRWARDSRTLSPWIAASEHEQPYRTDEIGRIVEVLSEGVDL
jgi:hypothetical protein